MRVRVPKRLLRRVTTTDLRGGPRPAAGAPAYGFAGDSEGALRLAGRLLAGGAALSRVPGSGDVVLSGATDHTSLIRLAAERRVPLRALTAPPPGAVALRRPKIAMLAGGISRSGAWSRHVIERRLGLQVDPVTAPEIGTGRLTRDGHTALVVPDGTGQDLAPAALTALQAWVHAGGTLVGLRGSGIAVARAAGLTGAALRPPSPTLRVPGALLGIDLDAADPLAWGTGGAGFAFNDTDPVLDAGSAHVVARYPGAGGFFLSGYAEGTEALHGTAAATHERVGAGHVVLFAFDPAFRGYAEGTQRLLANALLIPATAAAQPARRQAARAVEPAFLAAIPSQARDSLVTVSASDEQHLLDAAADARIPSAYRVRRDPTTSTLVVSSPRLSDPGEAAWPRRLLAVLAAAGVRPLYAGF